MLFDNWCHRTRELQLSRSTVKRTLADLEKSGRLHHEQRCAKTANRKNNSLFFKFGGNISYYNFTEIAAIWYSGAISS